MSTFGEMAFGNRWRKAASALTAIGLIAGTITAVAKAFPTVEPLIPAHREWVRDYSSPTAKKVTELAISLNEIEQRRLVSDLRNVENELKGDLAKSNPQYKNALQLGADHMRNDLNALEVQNKRLRTEIGE